MAGSADEAALALAADCVLDWVGVATAARQEELAAVLCRFEQYAGGGTASSLASGATVPPQTAALINGTLAHVLDYDDVMARLPGHCGAPVVASALAVAETAGRSWGAALRGVVAGVEVMCALGDAWGAALSRAGWHPTAALGVFGAAASAAITLGFDEDALTRALAGAATGSSGLKHAFGSHGKSWQVGLAAHNGVLAALAAASGLAVTSDILDPGAGWPSVYCAREVGESGSGHDPSPRIHDTVFKRYAACFATHSAIAAAEGLGLAGTDLGPDARIEIEVGPQFHDIVTRNADTGLELKFHVGATVALVVLGCDLSDPALFTDATARRADVRSLLERTAVRSNDRLDNVEAIVTVDGGPAGGRSRQEPSPGPPSALERRALLDRKLSAVLSPWATPGQVRALRDEVTSRADDDPVAGLLRATWSW
ncbi:hypothetical protein Acsp06_60500 [Actinomycetospora sp. NBRC 106375]|nr:hypothetical protein Acsp06_60500 [Actinomycetospora sp. NBRC 106375]